MKKKKSVFSFAKAEDSSGFLLWQVTNLWQRGIRKALEPLDLTHPQFVLLASTQWLTMNNTSVTQIVLSDHTKIDPMTTSMVLRTLQKKKLIERKEHATDTRAKTVELTAEGKQRVRKAVEAVESFDHEFFARLGDKQNGFNHDLVRLLRQEEEN